VPIPAGAIWVSAALLAALGARRSRGAGQPADRVAATTPTTDASARERA